MPSFWIGKLKFLLGFCFKFITWPNYLKSPYSRYNLTIKKPTAKVWSLAKNAIGEKRFGQLAQEMPVQKSNR